jgi:hypothetical protein
MTSNAVMFILRFHESLFVGIIVIRRADTCTDMVMHSLVFYSVTQLALKSACADMNVIVNVCCRCILSNCVLCDEVEVCNNSELKDCLVGSHHTVAAGGKVPAVLFLSCGSL